MKVGPIKKIEVIRLAGERGGLVRIHEVNGVDVRDRHVCNATHVKGHHIDNRIPEVSNIWHCGMCQIFFFRPL